MRQFMQKIGAVLAVIAAVLVLKSLLQGEISLIWGILLLPSVSIIAYGLLAVSLARPRRKSSYKSSAPVHRQVVRTSLNIAKNPHRPGGGRAA